MVDCVDRANLPLIFMFVAFAAVAVVVIIAGIYFYIRRKRKTAKNGAADSLIVSEDVVYTKLEDQIDNENTTLKTALEPAI